MLRRPIVKTPNPSCTPLIGIFKFRLGLIFNYALNWSAPPPGPNDKHVLFRIEWLRRGKNKTKQKQNNNNNNNNNKPWEMWITGLSGVNRLVDMQKTMFYHLLS